MSVVAGVVIGCLSIGQPECEDVAAQILRVLPAGRGVPFSIALQLYECRDAAVCAKSLAARNGQAIVEFADGGAPIVLSLAGPPAAPRIQVTNARWSDLQRPRSARVVGRGPFQLQLGHCGLLWQVDFDGSFWVPVGQLDGDATAIINAATGQMVLFGPNLATFSGPDGFTAGLQRFPGPKRVFLCA